MDHRDHVELLRPGVPGSGGSWGDFGSGTGAFTLALAELLGPGSKVYSIDKDRGALHTQERSLKIRFPRLDAHLLQADFTQPLDLPPLDGIVMANVLHFFAEKSPSLQAVFRHLRPGGRFILVEYNVDGRPPDGYLNRWVPYPLSYPAWEALAQRSGFVDTRLLATRPSSFLGSFYSALSFKPDT